METKAYNPLKGWSDEDLLESNRIAVELINQGRASKQVFEIATITAEELIARDYELVTNQHYESHFRTTS